MCGRFAIRATPESLSKRFGVAQSLLAGFAPRYNAAPGQQIGVIAGDRPDRVAMMRWGLVPPWAHDDRVGFQMINARSETVRDKRAFRDPFRFRRCIVPADGFYEWKMEKGMKQPYFIYLDGDAVFAFAGLWERWPQPAGGVLETFTIMTTEPNGLVAVLHDRMAVILPQEAERTWLFGSPDEAFELLRPYPAEQMRFYPVSAAVNRPQNEGPALTRPAPPPPEQGSLFG